MKSKTLIPSISLFLFALLVAVPSLQAADLDQIRERMEERLPTIDSLKEQGLLGVTNDGLLSARGSISTEEDKMVKAENKDRMTVYQEIAKQTGQPVDKVQKQRAAQLAKTSAPGVWLQDAKGKWYRKQ